jgi:hypothetical protein
MLTVAEATEIVEVLQAVEAQQFFMYVAVNDSRTCDRCDHYDQSSMTRREAEGTFPYLIKYTPTLWFPMVHPNCRCVLMFEEEELPRPDMPTNKELVDKLHDEILLRHPELVQAGVDRSQVEAELRRIIIQRVGSLDVEDAESDEDTWDMIILGVLDTVKKRKK